MPALQPSPLQVAVPGHTRRRVWAQPELRSHGLAVLTYDRLYVAPPGRPPRPEVVAAAGAGGDLDTLFGPLATAVDLAAVRGARLDLLTNSLTLEHAVRGLSTARLTLVFATPDAADACFTKVWRRLGDGVDLLPYRRDRWALARTPLAALGTVLAVTAVLALVLSVFDDFAAARAVASLNVPGAGQLAGPVRLPAAPLAALAGWVDWRVVCGVGGAVAAAAQVWLVRRLTAPPVALELVRA